MTTAIQERLLEPEAAELLGGPLDEPGFAFTPTGLIIQHWVTFEQWEKYGRKLQLAEKGIQWALGDWIIWGEQKFKERAAQAVEFTGLKIKTLQNYATVAEAIPQSRRRDLDLVDYSTHAEVASLPPTEQERILSAAEHEDLTVKQIRREVHRAKRKMGQEKSELEILVTPEVQEFLDGYIEALKAFESHVPLTASFLRNMVQSHIGQAQWQKERSISSDCEVILQAIDEYNGISDDDLFQWLQARGYFMRDPELDARLEYMKSERVKLITETDAGHDGKQQARRGKLPTFYVRYFKKRPKMNVVEEDDEDAA